MARAVGLGAPGAKGKDDVKALKAEIRKLKIENSKLQAELDALKAKETEVDK